MGNCCSKMKDCDIIPPQVDNECYESDPCRHKVTFMGETKMMDGVDIYNLFKLLDLEIPKHFLPYNDPYYTQDE